MLEIFNQSIRTQKCVSDKCYEEDEEQNLKLSVSNLDLTLPLALGQFQDCAQKLKIGGDEIQNRRSSKSANLIFAQKNILKFLIIYSRHYLQIRTWSLA